MESDKRQPELQGQQQASQPQAKPSTSINWYEYNFPPFLHLVHFRMSELQGPVKRFVVKAYSSFVIVVAVLFINVLSTIIQATKYSPGIEVFYSILNLFVFIPAAGFTFYRGYLAVAKRPADPNSILWYRVTQTVLCILWFIFSIVMAGSFDGWVRVAHLSKYNDARAKFCIFLAVLQSLGYTTALALGVVCIMQVSQVFFK